MVLLLARRVEARGQRRRNRSPEDVVGSRDFSRFPPLPAHNAAMQKRVQVALAVLLVTLAGVSAWLGLREREPVYQGKRLSVWLKILRKEPGPSLRCSAEARTLSSTMIGLLVIGDLSRPKFSECFVACLVNPDLSHFACAESG